MCSLSPTRIPAEDLTEAQLRRTPVWEFCAPEIYEPQIRPVENLPVSASQHRLFGCELRFADGTPCFGFITNLSFSDAERNQHLVMLSLFIGSEVFDLARYHDFDIAENGPAALANKLRKQEKDVFPISWDLSHVASGPADCIRGKIPREPTKRLSQSEMIQLAVRKM